MRFKRILTLVKTNLIFATQPAQLQNYRKKQAKNPTKPVNVAMRTLIQQLMFAVISKILIFSLNSLTSVSLNFRYLPSSVSPLSFVFMFHHPL